MENGLRTFITLLGVVVAAALGGCSDSDDNGQGGVREVALTLTQVDEGDTRAVLGESGNKLMAEWTASDRVTYFNLDANRSGTLGVTPDAGNKATAQFSGMVACQTDALNKVAIIYPTASVQSGAYTISLAGQDGTLATLAEQFHHIYGLSTKFYVGSDSPTAQATVTMESLLTVCKFTFTEGTNAVPVRTLQISYGGSNNSDSGAYPQSATVRVGDGRLAPVEGSTTPLTVTCGGEASEVYVALLPTDGQRTFHFTVTNSTGTYIGTAKATLNAGKYVAAKGLKLTIGN